MPQQLQPEEILALPLVQQSFDAASRYLIGEIKDRLHDEVLGIEDSDIESPIEAVFLAWWIIETANRGLSHDPLGLELCRQHSVALSDDKNYRLDFVVVPDDKDEWFEASNKGIHYPDIAVELDGHEWHERTKEQVAYRNQRDRALQAEGWKVFHFSGSEAVRRPLECVTEVMDFANGALWQMRRQLRAARRAQGRA